MSKTTRRDIRTGTLRHGRWAARAFSLIELVIVIVIMGTIVAIALPRLAHNSNDSKMAALRADFRHLNNALELYRVEHGGDYPSLGGIVECLTQYSNKAGDKFDMAPNDADGVVFGPYLQRIPPVPVGPYEGNSGIGSEKAADVGWLYIVSKSVIVPSLDDGSGPPADLVSVVNELVDDVAGAAVPDAGK